MPSLAVTLVGVLLALAPAAQGGEPATGAALGRSIYHQGVGEAGGEIMARIGGAGAEVPASMLPCVNCHGEDGRGEAEGGVSPSDLTWRALTKPYGLDHPSGRQHPPYDEYLLKRAITQGIDPAGNRLHVAMPRYLLAHGEAEALVAYVKGLGEELDPGVDDGAVRLGVVLPPAGRLGGFGEAVRALLTAFSGQVNEGGGVYGRRLELEFVEAPEEAAARRQAVEAFLAERPIFALVSAFMEGAEDEMEALIREREIPLVGPFTTRPRTAFPLNRFIFYLLPGLEEQARALVDFASRRLGSETGPIRVVNAGGPDLAPVVEAVLEQGSREAAGTPWAAIGERSVPPAAFDPRLLVTAERQAGTSVLFFLGDEAQTTALLREAAVQEWRPHVVLLAPLAGRAPLAAGAGGDRVYLAFPSTLQDRTAGGLAGYRELAGRFDLPEFHLPIQLAALSAAKVLLEALEQSGRELSRERLIAALEGLHDFETGLMPQVTFGPNRRVGALGAYVVPLSSVAGGSAPAGQWVSPR